MTTPAEDTQSGEPYVRTEWEFVLDVIMFQVKLFVGGFLGVILGPVTLAAAAMDIVFRSETHGSRFYRVMDWCRRAEEVLGLYAPLDRHRAVVKAGEEVGSEAS